MKIAALYDIHGNVFALQAVLTELEELKPDLIVIGGDILSGPMPVQTLERLLQLSAPVQFIRGNCDREVALAYDGIPLRPGMSEKGREITEWVANQLTTHHREFLEQLPAQYSHSVEGIGEVLFCHATPGSDDVIFTPMTDLQRLEEIFENVQQRTVICGHTHIQFDMRIGETRVVNAGSVGMPYADEPGAYWLLLGPEGCEFRKTSYDVEAAAREIQKSLYPQAKEFADENVRKVPTAEEAIGVFEKLRNL
ncbi:metallophosphoesterase family protein [Brevibacillus choshinensis]|uniref:Metallophosphoesterase family protein n=1 Tax=Brevibacillus choshinensis TaxID=54911 RepID=A0ABX7FG27_BRECH|nr:metallophosphoesterase family protein [Brevibacillus choshinensis]QRG65133.1 metallophosphoesterase family protein [Brevibacillus choshinensis]